MAEVILNVRDLNENPADGSTEINGLVKMLDPKFNPEHYEDARFLGRGTCTTSQIFYTSPSRCAVADSCAISIDRRMTAGETYQSCLKEIEDLPACKKYAKDVKVSMYMYDRPAWTGHVYETECFFPTWINKETAPHVQALVDAHHNLWGDKRLMPTELAASKREGRPLTDKWTFSTNGVSIQGRYGIPCVGFGPGAESQAHAPNEVTFKQDLVDLRRPVCRRSRPVQAREQGRLRHQLPSGADRQRHQVIDHTPYTLYYTYKEKEQNEQDC